MKEFTKKHASDYLQSWADCAKIVLEDSDVEPAKIHAQKSNVVSQFLKDIELGSHHILAAFLYFTSSGSESERYGQAQQGLEDIGRMSTHLGVFRSVNMVIESFAAYGKMNVNSTQKGRTIARGNSFERFGTAAIEEQLRKAGRSPMRLFEVALESGHPTPGSCVYVIGCDEFSPIKIGCTLNVEKRLNAIQTSCPYVLKIRLIAYTARRVKLESALHEIFEDNRMIGEWFENPDIEKIALICKQSDALVLRSRENILTAA